LGVDHLASVVRSAPGSLTECEPTASSSATIYTRDRGYPFALAIRASTYCQRMRAVEAVAEK
jgi:hypothetical protein